MSYYTPAAPGASNSTSPNRNVSGECDAVLRQFSLGLADHKKKQSLMLQNFLAANAKFDEVTERFMVRMKPMLQATAEQHRRERDSLTAENQRLKLSLSQLSFLIGRHAHF